MYRLAEGGGNEDDGRDDGGGYKHTFHDVQAGLYGISRCPSVLYRGSGGIWRLARLRGQAEMRFIQCRM